MERCPRCGDLVEGLEPLPAESLQRNGRDQTSVATTPGTGMACRWCRHELLEG